MRSELHVEVDPLTRRDDRIVIGAQIHGHPRRRNRNGKVWIEVPAELSSWLAIQEKPDDSHDAFARMTVLSAMEADCDLIIHGNVSVSLLANLERWQEIVTRWWPTYRRVHLSADCEVSASSAAESNNNTETILAFTGGLDSVEALCSHRLGRRGRNTRNVTTCLFVHGFDIDWREARFSAACDRARRLCEPWGVNLTSVRTNLKQLLPPWTLSHPTAITGVLSLFQRQFVAGLLASSRAYDSLNFVISENSSTALTDSLLSASTFQVIHDLAITRIEKTMSLRDHPEVWKSLRVCWEGRDPAANCGVCEKCIRQMLCMLAVGVDDFSGFNEPLTPEAISRVRPHRGFLEDEWQACHALAQQQGCAQRPEFQALRRVLQQCTDVNDEPAAVSANSVHTWKPDRSLGGWLQRILGML